MSKRVLALVSSVACVALGCSELAHLGDPPVIRTGQPKAGDEVMGDDGPGAPADAVADSTDHDGGPDGAMDATQEDQWPDASSDSDTDSTADIDAEAMPSPASCLDVHREDPDASSGLYSVSVDGRSLLVYCNMDLDRGGWTAFFVDRLGGGNVIGHFEDPTDNCPLPNAACLRHTPSTVTPANEFAAVCGVDAIRFKAPGTLLEYWEFGASSGWTSVGSATAIAGSANPSLAKWFFTGEGPTWVPPLQGWAIAGDFNLPQTNFASSMTGTGEAYCNGVDYNDAGPGSYLPIVSLLYR